MTVKMDLGKQRLIDTYKSHNPTSFRLAKKAKACFPGAATHQSRQVEPFEIFVSRAQDSKKWDVDGHQYIDYVCGHGALILGHSPRTVTNTLSEATSKGIHLGANTELELEWADAIKQCCTWLEHIRFTASGGEAIRLACLIARAATGKSLVLKLPHHFHGWMASDVPDIYQFAGLPVDIDPSKTLEVLEAVLNKEHLRIAAIVIEPTGAGFGKWPTDRAFLAEVRDITRRSGVLLIADEVLTGFRVSPGGAQEQFQVYGDISAYGKILAGGYPGGAIAGSRDLLSVLTSTRRSTSSAGTVAHLGTHNGNILSALAGTATLRELRTHSACHKVHQLAKFLVSGLNKVFKRFHILWQAEEHYSGFHIKTRCPVTGRSLPLAAEAAHSLRLSLSLKGIHLNSWPGGLLSTAHTKSDIEETAIGFEQGLEFMKTLGLLNQAPTPAI